MTHNYNFKALQVLSIFGLMATTSIMASTSALAQSFDKPITKVNVERKSGNCPNNVGLWWMPFGFEGGADHIVVADIKPIADNAKVIKYHQKLVEYEAPLLPKYASCVGQGSLYMYSFQFRNRKVYFRVNLEGRDGYLKIINKQLAGGRPYVFWQAAE